MKRLLYLLLAAAMTACAPAVAQLGWIELQPKYGMTQANASQSLTAAGLTEDAAKQKFPRLWARYQATGKTIAQMMVLNYCVASANDAFWVGHAHAMTAQPAGSGNIQFGPIKATVNDQMLWPFGRIEGVGTFSDSRYNTNLTVDHSGWKGDPAQRNIIVSPTYGGSGAMAYHESAKVTNLSLNGNAPGPYNDPSFSSSGLVCWDLGEGSHVGDIRANDFNDYGVLNERGTPAHFDNITGFRNRLAAYGSIGGALSNQTIGVLSGDDNPWLVWMRPGHGREAGGTINVNTMKLETSTTPEGAWGPNHHWTGGGAAYCAGQFEYTCDNLTFASPWITSAQLFYVDARLTNGALQQSCLEVKGKGFGYAAFLVDAYWGYMFPAPPPYSAFHAVYYADKGELYINGIKQTPQPFLKNAGPMGPARAGQTLNFATATPQMQITGTPPIPPPVTCTWVPGVETCGPCQTNNTQTCTTPWVSSVTGCSPTGSQPSPTTRTQACGTPPPGGTFTVSNLTVGRGGHDLNPDWTNVRTLTFEGFVATTDINSRELAGWDVPGQTVRGMKIGSAGNVYENSTGSNTPLAPNGTVKLNQAVTFTVTLSTPRTIKHLGGWPTTGNGQTFTVTKVTGAP